MPDPTLDELRMFPQLHSFLVKGVGADRAFQTIRDIAEGTNNPENVIRRSVVRQEAKRFRDNLRSNLSRLPTQNSARLKEDMATKVDFNSPIDHRYLLDYRFKALNPESGKWEWVTDTIGFRKLMTMGELRKRISERLEDYAHGIGSNPVANYADYDAGSVQITSFVRTLNN